MIGGCRHTVLARLGNHVNNHRSRVLLESVLGLVELLPGLGLSGVAGEKAGGVHVGEEAVDVESVLRHGDDW